MTRTGPLAARRLTRHRLGRATVPVLAGFTALAVLALGVPVGASVYWIFAGGIRGTLDGVSMPTAALHTAGYGAAAGALDTLAALPMALLVIRHPGGLRQLLERHLLPGAGGAGRGHRVRAVLLHRAVRGRLPVPERAAAGAVLRDHVLPAGAGRRQGRRWPGRRPAWTRWPGRWATGRLAVLGRVTLRLAAPGLAAAFCLVFLSVVTELTATLLLIPTGCSTLATQFWSYEQNLSYGQAAPFALVMIAVAAVPSYVLGRFFDRSAAARRG